MAIKRVWIEEDCIACGTCEGICPEVFTVTDRSRVNESFCTSCSRYALRCVSSCPVEVIKYE